MNSDLFNPAPTSGTSDGRLPPSLQTTSGKWGTDSSVHNLNPISVAGDLIGILGSLFQNIHVAPPFVVVLFNWLILPRQSVRSGGDRHTCSTSGHRSYQGFAGNRLTDSGHRQTGDVGVIFPRMWSPESRNF